MKIQKINETDYQIMIWKQENIKELLKKIQKYLSLKGLYQVIVTKKPYGIFLQLRLFYQNKKLPEDLFLFQV